MPETVTDTPVLWGQEVPQTIAKKAVDADTSLKSAHLPTKGKQVEFNPFSATKNLSDISKALYTSSVYAKASPEMKVKVEDMLYKKYEGLSKKMYQHPMTREQWNFIKPQERANYIAGMRNHAEKYYIEDARAKDIAKGKATEPGLLSGLHIVGGGIATSALDIAHTALQTMAGFIRDPGAKLPEMVAGGPKNYEQKSAIGKEVQHIVQEFGGPLRHNYLEDVANILDHALDTPIANTKKEQMKDQNSINDHMSSKALYGLGYLTPAMLAWAAGDRALPSRSLNLSEFLGNPQYSGKLGKAVLGAANGAIDGYTYGKVSGEPDKDLKNTVVGFAGMEAGGPIAADAVKVMFAKLGVLFGGKFVTKAAEQTARTLEETAQKEVEVAAPMIKETPQALKTEPEVKYKAPQELIDEKFGKGAYEPSTKDPLVGKLNTAMAKVYNDVAQKEYKQLYQMLPPEKKRFVVIKISRDIAEALHYPAAYDVQGAQIAYTQTLQAEKQRSPEVGKVIEGLEKATQKATGSPILKGAAAVYTEDAAKEARAAAQDIFAPAKGSKKQKIAPAPGAARINTAEFDKEYPSLLQSLSLNRYPESLIDKLGIMYMNVQRGHIKGATANRIAQAYEAAIPDPTMRYGHQEGLKEHLVKLFHTGHLGDEHIFRSGNYMHDDLRDVYGMPKTEWQEELDEEWQQVMKRGKK